MFSKESSCSRRISLIFTISSALLRICYHYKSNRNPMNLIELSCVAACHNSLVSPALPLIARSCTFNTYATSHSAMLRSILAQPPFFLPYLSAVTSMIYLLSIKLTERLIGNQTRNKFWNWISFCFCFNHLFRYT